MTYVVKDDCIRCKHMDCVKVCPTDCFHEGENMLVIDPDDCIDCGLCVPECPVDAIVFDDEAGIEFWLNLNARYAKIWPLITEIGTVPEDSEKWKGVPDKKQYFSDKPGDGD